MSRRLHVLFVLLQVVLFGAGLVYLYLFPYRPEVAQEVYIDENGLIAGAGVSSVRDSHRELLRAGDVAIARAAAVGPAGTAADSIRQYLIDQMTGLGLEIFRFEPSHVPHGSDGSALNRSLIVSGILRAPKSDGKECVVLVTEFNANHVGLITGESQASGITIGLTLMNLFAAAKWVARDVIFVVVDASAGPASAHAAFGEWMNTYHTPVSGDVRHSSYRRAGMIVSGVVLDAAMGRVWDRVTLRTIGHFGLLPNLDLPSLILRMCAQQRLPVSIAEANCDDSNPIWSAQTLRSTPHAAAAIDPYWKHRGVWRFLTSQAAASSESTGYHGFFLDHNVDAATLRTMAAAGAAADAQAWPPRLVLYVCAQLCSPAVARAAPSSQSYADSDAPFYSLSALESTFRSVNNLIEKLHHSTWLFALSNQTEFVTMSKYIYAFVLIGLPLPLFGFYFVFTHPDFAHSRIAHSLFVMLAVYGVAGTIALAPRFVVSIIGHSVVSAPVVWIAVAVCTIVVFAAIVWPYLNAQFPAPAPHLILAPARPPVAPAAVRVRYDDDDSEDDELSAAADAAVAAAAAAVAAAPVAVPAIAIAAPPSDVITESCACDWRSVKGFIHLWMTVGIPPLAVLNFGLSLLTLLVVLPILVPAIPPTRHFTVLANGDTVRSRTCASFLHRLLCGLLLIVFSPISLLAGAGWWQSATPLSTFAEWCAAATTQFNLFVRHTAVTSAVQQHTAGNLLPLVIAYIYVPAYVTACVMALCTRTIITRPAAAAAAADAGDRKKRD